MNIKTISAATFILMLASVAFSSLADLTPALETIDDVRVGPLVQSCWDQMYAGGNSAGGDPCYNYYTPGRSYCGCGATCFAQIMRYHEWPQTAVDTHTVVCDYDGLTKKTKQVDSFTCKYNGVTTNLTMIGGVYDWSKMALVTQPSGTSDTSREMIGRICYDIGVAMGSHYNPKGTGCSSSIAVHALPGNFHYADAAAIEWSLTSNMNVYSLENLERALLPSLDAGLPCGLMIDSKTGGRHIVVCDGYGYHGDGLYVHLNVGYSGRWNGWYRLDGEWAWTINGFDYTSVAGIVYNISPHVYGPIVSGRIVDLAGRPVAGAAVRVSCGETVITNLVSDTRGNYVFKTAPGDYAISAEKGGRSRTIRLTLPPCVSSIYYQDTGAYLTPPVAAVIGNKVHEDILLDDCVPLTAPTSIPADGTTFVGMQYVELLAPDGAEIRYTIDGSIPDRSSLLYTEAFIVDRTTTVRAIAYGADCNSSEVASFLFVESTYGKLLGCPDTPWTSGGFAPWYKDEDYDYNQPSLYGKVRSGVPPFFAKSGESTWLEAVIDGPATVSFAYRYNPYYYSAFSVTQDGTTTNLFKSEYYVSSPSWENASFSVASGRHRVRFAYTAGSYRLQGWNGVHIDQMKVVYPNRLSASIDLSDDRWSWLNLTDGSRTGIWRQLAPVNPKVTVSTSRERTLTIDMSVAVDLLNLVGGDITLISEDGATLTAGSVRVEGKATIEKGALQLTGALQLMSKTSSVLVKDGVGIVPVSAVSGARVVAEQVTGGLLYTLELSYVAPFSAEPVGAADWSTLPFTDRNGNAAPWPSLGVKTPPHVTLKVASAASLNVPFALDLRSLVLMGVAPLSLTSSGSGALACSETSVGCDLTVTSTACTLGAATLADGVTLAVPTLDAFSSLTGAGTLRLIGTWPASGREIDAAVSTNVHVVFAGTLPSGAAIHVSRELTVASGASVQGEIVLTDAAAQVFAETGASLSPSCGVPYYEVASASVEGGTLYTLRLAKIDYVGPFSASLDVAEINWRDIEWLDSLGRPGKWADIAESGSVNVSLVAARDVVITMAGTETPSALATSGAGHVTLSYPNGLAVPVALQGALTNEAWTGTLRMAGSRSFTKVELGNYGNVRSTIELAGSISGSLAANGRCTAALVLAKNTMVTINSGTAGSTYTFAGALAGSGEFYFSGSSFAERLCFTGDLSAFCGCANANYGRTVVYGEPTAGDTQKNCVVVNGTLTVAGESYVGDAVLVSGSLTLVSGACFKKTFNTYAPVRLCSLSARVFVKNGCSVVPVSGLADRPLIVTKEADGTLYTLVRPPKGMRVILR